MPATISGISALAAIRKVTLLGVAINLVLALIKTSIGILSGSVALIADGIHSISDLATDAIVLAGAYFGALPPDDSHPYGHGKIENFAALLVSLFLISAGVKITYDSGLSLYDGQSYIPGWSVLIAALFSVLSKEYLFQVTQKVARQTQSPSVLANAWHHRSDGFSSIAVLAGAVAGMFGWEHGDQVAGIIVGIMVVGAGGKIAFDATGDLLERSIGKKDLAAITGCLDNRKDVLDWHRLRTRKLGREILLDVHILVNPELRVGEGHEIAVAVEEEIGERLRNPVNFTIHIEPYVGEEK